MKLAAAAAGAVRLIEGLYNLNRCGPPRPSLLRYVTDAAASSQSTNYGCGLRAWRRVLGEAAYAPMPDSFDRYKAGRMTVPGVIYGREPDFGCLLVCYLPLVNLEGLRSLGLTSAI